MIFAGWPPGGLALGGGPARFTPDFMKFGHTIVALYLAWTGLLHAAPGGQQKLAIPQPIEMDFLQIMSKGGVCMVPLAALSVILMMMIFLYLISIRKNAVISDKFMLAMETSVRKGDLGGLLAMCEQRNESMARITQSSVGMMLDHPETPFQNIREVAQTEGSRQAGMLMSRITYLADIGSIAPMIGLLGTVIGMIKAFVEISAGEVQGVKQMGLAQGVSEALIATAFGLAISIVALVFYAFFRSRVQKYITELEHAATHMLALLHLRHEGAPVAPSWEAGKRTPVKGL